jgi:hypothetical protein
MPYFQLVDRNNPRQIGSYLNWSLEIDHLTGFGTDRSLWEFGLSSTTDSLGAA